MGSYNQSLIVPLSCSFLFTLFPCSCKDAPQITVLIRKYSFAYSRVLQGLQWGCFHCCGTSSPPFSDLAVPFVLLLRFFIILLCSCSTTKTFPSTPNTDDNASHCNKEGTRISSGACVQYETVFFLKVQWLLPRISLRSHWEKMGINSTIF